MNFPRLLLLIYYSRPNKVWCVSLSRAERGYSDAITYHASKRAAIQHAEIYAPVADVVIVWARDFSHRIKATEQRLTKLRPNGEPQGIPPAREGEP